MTLPGLVGAAAAGEPPQLCPVTVGILATDFVYKVPNSELARVEIRRCPGPSDFIQLAAWASGRRDPALVTNTDDFGTVQAVCRENIFVIETGGATRDEIFVITYERGAPRIALRRVTKGSADVRTDDRGVDVVIHGIYAGNARPKTEQHRFRLDANAMQPR